MLARSAAPSPARREATMDELSDSVPEKVLLDVRARMANKQPFPDDAAVASCDMALRCLQYERHAILQPEEAPAEAVRWSKDRGGDCWWELWNEDILGYEDDKAPDLRPDTEGPLTLVLIPREGE